MDNGSLRRSRRVVEAREAVSRAQSGARPRRPLSSLPETQLIDALRRNETASLDEFLIRYHKLLFDRARAAGIHRLDCEDCITELLEEVAEAIILGRMKQIRSLSGFLVRSFRNRYANIVLSITRRGAHVAEGVDGPGYVALAQVDGSSEHTRRMSAGPEWEAWSMTPAIERLVTTLDDGITDEERVILGWLSNQVPQRLIATWLGTTYAATTQRIWRLRERLREMLIRHSLQTTAIERRELDRFFRRAGVGYVDTLTRPRASRRTGEPNESDGPTQDHSYE
jgi:DNA-directed RNA polymerase specialized sigma24 family protein